jgi:hypothetical protein
MNFSEQFRRKQFKSNLKYVGMPCEVLEWARYSDCISGKIEFSNGKRGTD